MAFYMITYGSYEITEAFVGLDQDDVVTRARNLINRWPEYAEMENKEVIAMLYEDRAEFDMVKIEEEWKGYDLSMQKMRSLYATKSIPSHS